jgi:hypothetical protein
MSKVVVVLDGGLGNQMFQHAAGRALSIRLGLPLQSDLRPLRQRGDRTYGLGDFRLSEDTELITTGAPQRRAGRLHRLFRQLAGGSHTFEESSFTFDERIQRLKAPARLEGYFQSERYFSEFADQIRRDFTPRADLLAEIDGLASRLLPAEPCLSLHVRRGDYTTPAIMAVHGLLEAVYYERALRLVAERTRNTLPICVFTDDPAWVRANLALPGEPRFISEHTRTPLQDLILMSRCTHHITANSSFSWWGAWLNPSQDKVVVTPASWFQPASRLDTRDLRPAGWLMA